MANNTFLEIVVEGPQLLVKGFILGLVEGSYRKGLVLFSRENNIRTETFLELLLEWTHLHNTLTHVVIEGGLLDLIEKGLTATAGDLGLRLRSVKKIREASFDFEYEVYARKYGDDLKGLFAAVPAPLRLSPDYEPKEEVHPEGEEIDAYAPLPAYRLHARGTVFGPIDRLVEFYRIARAVELIKTGEIVLKLDEA